MNFNSVYEEYYGLVFSIASKYTDEPEDATQEVFIRIWRYMETLEDPRKIFYWIYSIARNTSINYARKKSTRPLNRSESLEDEIESDSGITDWYHDIQKIADKLPAKEKSLLLLKTEGYTQKEISERLGINRKEFYEMFSYIRELIIEEML